MEEVESFDIFDTILTRRFIRPDDLFYFLGLLLYKNGLLSFHPKEFQSVRIEAEKVAREKSRLEEVTLDEIYESLKSICQLDEEVSLKIKNKELELELLESIPIAENVKKLHFNAILVSDTYLPKSFLKILLNKNFIKPYREIFASSEVKYTKSSGKMYSFLLKNFRFRRHIGDNPHSDYRIPMKMGINSELYLNSKPTHYEKAVYEDIFIPFELRALIAGTMRATRLALFYEDANEQKLHEVSSNVIAPFLNLYSLWVLNYAKNLDLEKLYFLSRDGKILQEISLILKREFFQDHDIKLHYLPCSRKSLFLPACSERDFEPLKWIFEDKELSVESFCKLFNLQQNNDMPKALTFNYVVRNTRILERILRKSEEKREILVRYLRQEGFNKDSKIGIVDVGWKGRLQAALSRVLKSFNLYNDVYGITGFYVGLSNPVKNFGVDKRLSFFDSRFKYVLHAGLFETFTAAKHGSCVGYKAEGDEILPIFKDSINRDLVEFKLEVQQRAIKTFSEYFAESLSRYKIEPKIITSYSRRICRTLLSKFIYFPSKEEVKVFSGVKHAFDAEHSEYGRLCRKLSFYEMLALNFPTRKVFKKFKIRKQRVYWVEGSNVLTLPTFIAHSINYLRLLLKMRP